MKSQEIIRIAMDLAESESFNIKLQKSKSWESKAAEAVGVEDQEFSAKIGKKRIRMMKNMLSKAKKEVEITKKRTNVITPELFELAKKQKLV
jgi:hypothetical protein